MPFPAQSPRAFTRANIEALNPNQFGCYGILSGSTVVYVGKGDIRTRLLAHLNNENPRITRCTPTHWVDVVTNDADNVEKSLIVEFTPICNKKVG
jgi:hypothetical protein